VTPAHPAAREASCRPKKTNELEAPMTGEQRERQPPASYQIRVRGHLGATMRRAFPALHAETQGQDTLLQGVADQAALHGILAWIEALGLELLEVRRLEVSR
jgi:hypothetical protein